MDQLILNASNRLAARTFKSFSSLAASNISNCHKAIFIMVDGSLEVFLSEKIFPFLYNYMI